MSKPTITVTGVKLAEGYIYEGANLKYNDSDLLTVPCVWKKKMLMNGRPPRKIIILEIGDSE